jgi:hypothetical protein
VLLLFTVFAPECTTIAPSVDIALTVWAQTWLESFTISGFIFFLLEIFPYEILS